MEPNDEFDSLYYICMVRWKWWFSYYNLIDWLSVMKDCYLGGGSKVVSSYRSFVLSNQQTEIENYLWGEREREIERVII